MTRNTENRSSPFGGFLVNHNIILVLILFSIGVFYISTIRYGQSWGGDFALYIAHAKNIATGHAYGDTNFVYDEFYKKLSPRQYPPGFPILLSIFYKFYGLNLFPMKLMNISFFILSLLVYFYIVRIYSSSIVATLSLSIFAFMPYIWQFKDHVRPEYTFAFFSLCAIALWEALARQDSAYRSTARVILSLAVSLLIALSYETRSVGIVLLPAMMIHGLIKYGKIRLESWIVGSLVTLFYLLYNYITKADASYISIFSYFYPSLPLHSFIVYIESFPLLWSGESGRVAGDVTILPTPLLSGLSITISILTAPLIVIGFIETNKKYISIVSIFVIFYCAILFVFPARDVPRYLIPIVPWLVYYMVVGLLWVSDLFKRSKAVILSIFLVFLSVDYVSAYAVIGFSPMKDGVFKKENFELFGFIKNKTSPSDVVIFRQPRVLALYAERKAAGYNPDFRGDFWPFLTRVKATYLVVATRKSVLWWPHGDALAIFVAENPERTTAVFHNSDYTVYRIR